MSKEKDDIGGVKIILNGDTSLGFVLRSLYEHICYFKKLDKSISKISANIYYATKEDLKITQNHKISAKICTVDELFESLIKQIEENKSLLADSVMGTKIYLNMYDEDKSRFLLFKKSTKQVLAEFPDKTKTNKHIDIKTIKGKENCKAYIFSKECSLDFIKKISEKSFSDIKSHIGDYDFINKKTFEDLISEKKPEPVKVKEETTKPVVKVEEQKVPSKKSIPEPEVLVDIDEDDLFGELNKTTAAENKVEVQEEVKAETTEDYDEYEDDDEFEEAEDPLSGDLDEDDYSRS